MANALVTAAPPNRLEADQAEASRLVDLLLNHDLLITGRYWDDFALYLGCSRWKLLQAIGYTDPGNQRQLLRGDRRIGAVYLPRLIKIVLARTFHPDQFDVRNYVGTWGEQDISKPLRPSKPVKTVSPVDAHIDRLSHITMKGG